MKKQLTLGTFVSFVVVLAMATSANAYSDAISINLSHTTVGDVSGPVAGADGFVASNWINTPYNAPGLRSGAGGILAGSTSTGTALSDFTVSLYTGGWGSLGSWTEASAADNTLGKTGWNVGNMSNTAWGWTRGDILLTNVPADFAAAGYDVYAYAGHSQTSLSWIKMTDVAPLTSVTPGRIFGSQSGVFGTGLIGGGQPCPADNWRVAAFQILKVGSTTPPWPDYLPGDFNKDGQVGPEDFGILKDQFGNSSLAHGSHESWTLGDANDDGQIGPEDFGLLKDNFGASNGPTGTYPLANVPEPTTLALLALAGLAIRRKR